MLLNACSLVSPTQYHPQLPNLHTVHIIILHKFTTTATTAAAAAATYITTYTEFLTTGHFTFWISLFVQQNH